jgi:hypothetical protein
MYVVYRSVDLAVGAMVNVLALCVVFRSVALPGCDKRSCFVNIINIYQHNKFIHNLSFLPLKKCKIYSGN